MVHHLKTPFSSINDLGRAFVMGEEHILQSETLMAHNLFIMSYFSVQLLHINY